MDEIKSWFEECNKVFYCGEYEFSIVNGFKLTHYFDDDTYTIQDTRLNDFYTEVTEEDLKLIKEYGFLDGTGIIMYHRNIDRVKMYISKIEELFTKRKVATKNLRRNKKFYTKQIKNCNVNIHKYNDLLHFYESKIEQFKQKFEILTKNN